MSGLAGNVSSGVVADVVGMLADDESRRDALRELANDPRTDRVLKILEVLHGVTVNEALQTLEQVKDLALDATVPAFVKRDPSA